MNVPVRPLTILHVLRSPVGGLFRHVVDLTRAQVARGHKVGLIADSSTGTPYGETILADFSRSLPHGVRRVPMSRHIGLSDIAAGRHAARLAAEIGADVMHGHGAKGGAYARLARTDGAIRVYTPHGGSLHYSRSSPIGMMYLTLERAMMPRTDLFLFESLFGRDRFAEKVGTPPALVRVVHNGVTEGDFDAVLPDMDSTDLVFIGELRHLKGVDLLLAAIAALAREGTRLTATIVGDGPDGAAFRAQATELGLDGAVRFTGAMPARQAFALGRVMVVPSRAESLPYIVLEAAAAGLPLIATRVGGIPEIFGPAADRLVAPDDAASLAKAVKSVTGDLDAARAQARTLRSRVHSLFSADVMTDAVLAAYADALEMRGRKSA